MDNLRPHILAALLFFWAWLASALVFTTGFCRGCTFRAAPSVVLAGLASVVACGAFLTVLTISFRHFDPAAFHQLLGASRPKVWTIAILEWCVVSTFFLWVLTVIAYLRRPEPR